MGTELVTHTIEKLSSFVRQIEHLLLSDFPHESTRDALKLFEVHFTEQISRVQRSAAGANRPLLTQACMVANSRIANYLPFLGFLLRSTNVRNNFECYDALLMLAQSLIGPHAKIIISSEWNMSPLTYALSVHILPGYVLLGMPAAESSNALILALTGHELGHSVWTSDNLENKWAPDVQKKIYENNQIKTAKVPPDFLVINEISQYALRQMEETYCDAVGISIFGESFVHAFHYLLAPSFGGQRSLLYPPLQSRAQFLVDYGRVNVKSIGYDDFPAEFQETQPALTDDKKLVAAVSDEITKMLAPQLYKEAFEKVQSKASNLIYKQGAEMEILALFKTGIPSREPRSLPDILNAGWQFVREHQSAHDIEGRPLFEWASELVLKSVEVMEFRRRINA